MTKELVLVTVVVISIVLAMLTLSRIRKAPMSKSRKIALLYLTIISPVIVFFCCEGSQRKIIMNQVIEIKRGGCPAAFFNFKRRLRRQLI